MPELTNRALTVADNLHYAVIARSSTAVLINEEVTDWTQTAAPETSDKQFIGEKNKRTSMKGYAPSVAYSAVLNPTDPFLMFLYNTGKLEQVGVTFDDIEVETWNQKTTGKFSAYKRTYEVQPSNPGSGAGGDDLKMEGTLSQKGSVIKGTFDISTKTFTADTAAVTSTNTTK